MKNTAGMSLIVKTVTGWVKAFILVFGAYIVLYGHLTPGGGFSGGVIVACAFILLTLAEGQRIGLKTVSKTVASEMDSVGALVFLMVALLGLRAGLGGVFFKNFIVTANERWFRLPSAGVMPICNIGIGLKVGMSLFMVFTILAAIRVVLRGEHREMVRKGEGQVESPRPPLGPGDEVDG